MTVDKPGENAGQPVDKCLADRVGGRDADREALRTSRFQAAPVRTCSSGLDGVISELERERHAGPVREYRPAFSRDYLDLLALADADIRHHDEQKRDSA